MIVALFYFLAGSVLYLFSAVLGTLSYIVPDSVESSLVDLMVIPNYLSGVFPVDQLYLALIAVLSVWLLMFFVKVSVMLLNVIPGVNIQWFHHNTGVDPANTAMVMHSRFKNVMKGRDSINTRR